MKLPIMRFPPTFIPSQKASAMPRGPLMGVVSALGCFAAGGAVRDDLHEIIRNDRLGSVHVQAGGVGALPGGGRDERRERDGGHPPPAQGAAVIALPPTELGAGAVRPTDSPAHARH